MMLFVSGCEKNHRFYGLIVVFTNPPSARYRETIVILPSFDDNTLLRKFAKWWNLRRNFETLLIHRLDETKQNAFQFNPIELITYYLSMLR